MLEEIVDLLRSTAVSKRLLKEIDEASYTKVSVAAIQFTYVMKILVADDAQYIRGVLRDMLEPEGHEIIEATNGNEALEKVSTEHPDLVLLDVIMPEMDGIEVLQKIGTTAKVIVISAVGQDAVVNEAKQLGAQEYLTKPIQGDEGKKRLLAVVQKVME